MYPIKCFRSTKKHVCLTNNVHLHLLEDIYNKKLTADMKLNYFIYFIIMYSIKSVSLEDS